MPPFFSEVIVTGFLKQMLEAQSELATPSIEANPNGLKCSLLLTLHDQIRAFLTKG
jgi:hypothetical protein